MTEEHDKNDAAKQPEGAAKKIRRSRISWKRSATLAEKEVAQLKAELTALQEEHDQAKDKHLRQAAEFQNYRRRVEEEKRDLREGARARAYGDLLHLFDMLDMALIAAEQDAKVDDLVQGLRMIEGQWQNLLTGAGVKPIPGMGEKFDPRFHEAVKMVPTTETAPGIITGVVRKGFLLGDKLLRVSQVVVAQAPEEPKAPEEAEPTDEDTSDTGDNGEE